MLRGKHPRLDPFVPTSWDMVGRIIDFAELSEDSVMVDLGSGDGRLVFEAAERYGCASIGVELDQSLVEYARQKAEALRLKNVAFINRDVRRINLSKATHITAYLTSRALKQIENILLTAPPNAIIVTHNYPIPSRRPTEVAETRSSSDGKIHVLYKYVPKMSAPARLEDRIQRMGAGSLDGALRYLTMRLL